MENYPIKSVTFGGFDKQDVIEYIERSSREAAEARQELEAENASLQEEAEALRMEAESLRKEKQTLLERTKELERICAQLQEKEKQQPVLPENPYQAEFDRLRAENETLRSDAKAYASLREQIGAIECEARKRAADLENAAMTQMRQTVDQFRSQYQSVMGVFEAAASHVTAELRKVEVNLSQLPRTMDRSGTELNELAAKLEDKGENK